MHHSDGPLPDRLQKKLRTQTFSPKLNAEQLADVQQRSKRGFAKQMQQAGLPADGITGKFPRGKLARNDAGDWRAAIGPDEETQTVIVQFGKPMDWLGMSPAQAVLLGKRLIECAEELLHVGE